MSKEGGMGREMSGLDDSETVCQLLANPITAPVGCVVGLMINLVEGVIYLPGNVAESVRGMVSGNRNLEG